MYGFTLLIFFLNWSCINSISNAVSYLIFIILLAISSGKKMVTFKI